jgi:hypothetical protein
VPRKNQNLTPAEAALLREIAAYHGHIAVSGPYAGQGSALALQLAIIVGEVQLVSLEEDELALVVPWLRAQADALPDGVLRDALLGIAYGLALVLPAATESGPPSGEGGPIDTLEG